MSGMARKLHERDRRLMLKCLHCHIVRIDRYHSCAVAANRTSGTRKRKLHNPIIQPNTSALTSMLSLPGQLSFVLGSTNAECGVLAPS